MLKNLPEGTRVVIGSIAPLAIVIILFVLVGQFGISKVSSLRDEIGKSQTDNNTLTQKLSILQSVSGTAQASSSVASTALPDKNPALTTLSQLKILSSGNNLVISAIKGGAVTQDPSGLSRSDISFNVDGGISGIIAFLNSIEKSSPISKVSKIKLTGSGGGSYRAGITVVSFFAPFPTKLPALTEPITDLTSEEKNTLNTVGSFLQPAFIEIPPAQAGGKVDPFSK